MNALTPQLNRADADALAVHCGDHRFQSAFHEFLQGTLNLSSYDLMVIPGGPLALVLAEPFPKYHWASWKWLLFFLEQHKLTRLILIQHQDCGFYKAMLPHLNVPMDALRQRQEEDLRRVRESTTRDLPRVVVNLYYASWDVSSRVIMDPIF